MERMSKLNGKTRGFEAVSGDRFRQDFMGTSQNADSFITGGGVDALRQHVRYMEFQTGFVRGPISRIVNNVVGSGFQFQSRVRSSGKLTISDASADRLNSSIESGFAAWCKQADIRMMHQFWVMCRLVEGSLIRDGEVLVIGRKSARPGRMIPYCQQVCEIDRLRTPPGEISNPRVRNGIRYDAEGVPEAYYILKNHPGDSLGIGFRADDYEEIPAFFDNGTRKVLYLYNPIRPEQLRGFSMFGPALKDFQDLDRYREAEIMAALEDACLTGFVKSDPSMAFRDGYAPDTDSFGNRIHEFAPNQWHYLNPGEDVTIHSPKRPNDAFKDLTEQLMMGPANALDIPPEVLSQNWHGLNYSNARTILLQLYMVCRIRQKYLIDYYCDPTYDVVLSDMVALGHVRMNDWYAKKEEYSAHQWVCGGWPWIDPQKEAQGISIELENGTENEARVWARKGEDWEEMLEMQARILRKRKELEEKYEVKFPAVATPQSQSDGSVDEEEPPAKQPPKRFGVIHGGNA